MECNPPRGGFCAYTVPPFPPQLTVMSADHIPPASAVTESAGLEKSIGGWQILFYGLGSMLGAGIYALVGSAAGTADVPWRSIKAQETTCTTESLQDSPPRRSLPAG